MAVLTGDALRQAEDEFTEAFNQCRPILAAFSKCEGAADLAVVRDGFHLNMARHLQLESYKSVEAYIMKDIRVAAAAAVGDVFPQTVASARQAPGWKDMVAAVMGTARVVGSDLAGIWRGLAVGRLEWLAATSATHALKSTLKTALENDGNSDSRGILEGDAKDAKMVWMYALASQLPPCKQLAESWAEAAHIAERLQPLEGFEAELWDPRKAEWEPLDLAVQAAAERGGTSLNEAWDL